MPDAPEACWRHDARAKVTGRARYADDLKVPGLLHAAPAYADHVHARLLAVRTEEAAAMPGVLRVLTAADVPGARCVGQIQQDFPVFASDRIRCHGDVVALVVARSRAEAIAAAARVTVEAEPLPALLDPEEALAEGAPLVHEARGTNVVNHHRVRRGDADAELEACDLVLDEVFRTQAVEHAYLEPESALAIPRWDGTVELRVSTQHPFSARRFVAAVLGVPLHGVELVGVPVGGGFGGKDDTAGLVAARAALAAKLLDRPVRLTYTREWSLRESYKRHPYVLHYRLGFTREGQMRAARVRMVADAGPYCSVTPWVTWRSTVQCCGPYQVPHVHADVYGVATHNPVTGAMRGFGSPQVNFAVEQLVEMAAERLGMDAVELRRRNLLRQGCATVTGQVLDTHVVSLEEVLDRVLEASDYRAKLARCGALEGEERYGIGMALSARGMSLGAEGVDACSAEIAVQPDGSVLLETGIHENGQGAESAMVLLCAEALGLPRERVRYRRSSTATIPDGGTTVASRGTLMGGGAVVEAARVLKARMAACLAPELGGPPETLRFEGSRVVGAQAAMAWEDAARALYARQVHPVALGTFRAPQVDWDEATGQGRAYFTWVYGCQCAEVAVNVRTGRVRLLNLVAAHDVGRAVNRPMVLGQFYGGLAMGSGYALTEELQVEGGRIRSANLDRYRLPRAPDLPEMTAIVVEHADPTSPSGAKGCGEPTLEITAPAIANAIARATGQRLRRLPLRPAPEA